MNSSFNAIGESGFLLRQRLERYTITIIAENVSRWLSSNVFYPGEAIALPSAHRAQLWALDAIVTDGYAHYDLLIDLTAQQMQFEAGLTG